ncbi:hypothetical protein V6N13_111544 [Hibiscus sabdariffa]
MLDLSFSCAVLAISPSSPGTISVPSHSHLLKQGF